MLSVSYYTWALYKLHTSGICPWQVPLTCSLYNLFLWLQYVSLMQICQGVVLIEKKINAAQNTSTGLYAWPIHGARFLTPAKNNLATHSALQSQEGSAICVPIS